MKLYIDTADRDKIVIKLDDNVFETNSHKEKSQELLPFLEKALKQNGKSLKDITHIAVNPGPGSFTGIRVGQSVAYALGLALGISVDNLKLPV